MLVTIVIFNLETGTFCEISSWHHRTLYCPPAPPSQFSHREAPAQQADHDKYPLCDFLCSTTFTPWFLPHVHHTTHRPWFPSHCFPLHNHGDHWSGTSIHTLQCVHCYIRAFAIQHISRRNVQKGLKRLSQENLPHVAVHCWKGFSLRIVRCPLKIIFMKGPVYKLHVSSQCLPHICLWKCWVSPQYRVWGAAYLEKISFFK